MQYIYIYITAILKYDNVIEFWLLHLGNVCAYTIVNLKESRKAILQIMLL